MGETAVCSSDTAFVVGAVPTRMRRPLRSRAAALLAAASCLPASHLRWLAVDAPSALDGVAPGLTAFDAPTLALAALLSLAALSGWARANAALVAGAGTALFAFATAFVGVHVAVGAVPVTAVGPGAALAAGAGALALTAGVDRLRDVARTDVVRSDVGSPERGGSAPR
jgi:hypothetical protein